MGLRRILKNYFASKSDPPIIEEDFLLSESKGPITKENILKELIDLDDAIIKVITVADESVTIIYMHSLYFRRSNTKNNTQFKNPMDNSKLVVIVCRVKN